MVDGCRALILLTGVADGCQHTLLLPHANGIRGRLAERVTCLGAESNVAAVRNTEIVSNAANVLALVSSQRRKVLLKKAERPPKYYGFLATGTKRR
jgi:hypothetical protein